MGFLLDKLFKLETKDKAAPAMFADIATGESLFGVSTFNRAVKKNKGWVYAAVRAIAEAFSAVPVELYRVNSKDEWERIYNHEILDLLVQPNPQLTGAQLKAITAMHLELAGNAFWLLDDVTSEKDKPKAIYPLDPSRVSIVYDSAEYKGAIKKYRFRKRLGGYDEFEPYQIIHLRWPNPADPALGLGTVEAASEWIEADERAHIYNKAFFANGARPGLILRAKKAITQQAIEIIRNSFSRIYGGPENANKVAVLPDDIEVQKLEWSNSDLQFSELLTKNRDAILAAFRVPRTVLGITDDVNRANAEATDYVFMSRNIKPKMYMFIDQLNAQLVPRYNSAGARYVLSYEDPTPDDKELKIREMEAATARQPVMSINEARDNYFGLPPIENGDAVMSDFSKVPLGAPKEKSAKTQVSVKFDLPSDKKEKTKKAIKNVAKEAEKVLQKKLKEIKENKKQAIADMTDEEFDALHKEFVQRVTQYENKFADEVRKFNELLRKEVTRKVQELFAKSYKKKVSPAELFNKGEWSGLLVNMTLPILIALYNDEANAAAAMLGIEAQNFLTDEAREAIERYAKLYADSYTETTGKLLAQKLTENQEQGADLAAMTQEVQNIFDYSDTKRAEWIARTETFRIGNYATRAAWQKTGVVKTIKWYTAADERVCEFCGKMHGKVIDIDGKFFEVGDTLEGSNGGTMQVDYADIEHPPLHTACRCYIRPWDIEI